MSRVFGFLLVLFLILSCEDELKNVIDVSGISADFSVNRFEKKFYTNDSYDLPKLKKEFPLMFPKDVHDSIWNAKKTNEDELFLLAVSQTVFGDFSDEKQELENLFKHIKHYNPKFVAPNITTHISDLDYEYPVIYADSLLFISLDMYLGKDNIVYQSFPKYMSENFEPKNIKVDVATSIIQRNFPKFRGRVFLDKMINKGRNLFLLDAFLPQTDDEIKIGYSKEKLIWAQENEINIWKYFIERDLLYSSDPNLNSRFLDIAPFSKFYQESDQDSPGQIGVWIGWQIVRSYMKNNDVTLQQLFSVSSEEIFQKSKYKPRK